MEAITATVDWFQFGYNWDNMNAILGSILENWSDGLVCGPGGPDGPGGFVFGPIVWFVGKVIPPDKTGQ